MILNSQTYQVNELFHTIQGEGIHTGKAATFIRLQGCTVGCPWCDSGPLADQIEGRMSNGMTRNTWARGGERRTVEQIVGDVYDYWLASDVAHIVITGGEPTLYNLDALIAGLIQLRPEGYQWPFIQLETSGQNNLKGSLAPDWVTWSPKKNLGYKIPEGLMALVKEVKWVVDTELDELTVTDTEAELFRMVDSADDMPAIILMPEGCPPGPESMKKCYEWALQHPSWRVADRLQYRMGVR